MKKVITFISVALLAFMAKPVHAQDDMFFENNYPEVGQPTAINLYPIWLDAGTESYYGVTPYIVQDLRPDGTYGTAGDPNVGNRFIDIWSDTYTFNEITGIGALGQVNTGYLDLSSLTVGWAGGGFNLLGSQTPPPIDLTGVTDDYRFHMDIRKTNPDPCEIWLYGGGDPSTGAADDTQRARFIVGVGDHVYTDPSFPNLTPDFTVNTWQVIDIPVSQLRTMSTSAPWDNLAPITSGYYFAYEFGSTNNNNLQFDAIFYYKVNSGDAVDNVTADNKLVIIQTDKTVNVLNATLPIKVYNVSGANVKTVQQSVFGVDELSAGIYIIKSGNETAKIVIK